MSPFKTAFQTWISTVGTKTRKTKNRASRFVLTLEKLEDRTTPSRTPVLLLPGIVGSDPTGITYLQWEYNLGTDPTNLQPNPVVYGPMITAMENDGYVLGQDLFLAPFDWRFRVAPPDEALDGVFSAVTAESLTDNYYQYQVDYLGYWLDRTAQSWEANHPGQVLDEVNILAHSDGNMVTRAYIQSAGYGGTYTKNGLTHKLPTINTYAMVAPPALGAAMAWNPTNNNFFGNTKLALLASVVYQPVYLAVEAGKVIHLPKDPITGLSKDITKATIADPISGKGSPVLFLEQYVGGLFDLLPTYNFIDTGDGQLKNINDTPKANRFMLDMNGGPNSNAFVNNIGNAANFYGTGGETITNANQFTGPSMVKQINAIPSVGLPRKAKDGEVYYVDQTLVSGDTIVPLESLVANFQLDTRITMNPFPGLTHSTILSDENSQNAILNTLTPRAAIIATAGTTQNTPINTEFTTPLQVTLKDSAGNPVEGVTVTFTAPVTGASGSIPQGYTAKTNALGVAFVPFMANNQIGSYQVFASVAALTEQATFNLTNDKDPNPITAWANGLYETILGRAIDPAGVVSWTAAIENGMNPNALSIKLWFSKEHQTSQVTGIYQSYLGRTPDAPGLAFWVTQMQGGMSTQQVVSGIVSSTEYQNQHSTNEDFVRSLYTNMLGRNADLDGLRAWILSLDSGTSREQVVAGFQNSAEAQGLALNGLYQTILDRASDLAGKLAWLNRLQSGQTNLTEVTVGFLTSPEFQRDHILVD